MKKILILLVAMVLVAGSAYGVTVVGSSHDMRGFITDETSTQVCVYCHTPHQAVGANAQDPLWNHTVTATAPFGIYVSDTIDSIDITEIGGAAAGAQSVSVLCMGCHDGTVAVNSLYKEPLVGNSGSPTSILNTNSAYLGTSLVDDHPVNFTYTDLGVVAADGGLNLVAAIEAAGIQLFATTVQCASCHDVHDSALDPFLRVSNTDSGLCTTCHNK